MKVTRSNWQMNPSKEDYYEEMFKNVPIDSEEVKYLVRDAIQEWKRRDRITYTLKIDRYFFCKKFPNHKSCRKIINNFEKKYGQLLPEDWTHGTGQLSHYLNFAINNRATRMLNLVWQDQSLEELLQILHELEQEHLSKVKEEDRYFIPEDEDEIILAFPGSGFYWVRLMGGYSSQEARSMGHCGVSSGDSILLSLRSKHESEVKSHLTFSWKPIDPSVEWEDTWGVLGERKGFKNSKPIPFYHKYIIELLRQPQIQVLLKASYKPESDFSLDDLEQNQKNELLQIKPQLASWKYLPVDKIMEFLKATDMHISFEGEFVKLLEVDSIYQLVLDILPYLNLSSRGEESVKVCIEYLEGEKFLEYWDLKPDKKEWIKQLKERNISLYKRLKNARIGSDEIYEAMLSAESTGWEAGTFTVMDRQIKNLLNFKWKAGTVIQKSEDKFKLLLPINQIGLLLDGLTYEQITNFRFELEEILPVLIDTGRHTWHWPQIQDEFDEEAAYSRFEEALRELLPRRPSN